MSTATRSAWRTALVTSRDQGLEEYTASLDAHPDVQGHVCRIGQISIAPIKSLGMLNLTKARITSAGLMTDDATLSDRSAMLALRVLNKPYQFVRLSQREEPALALVKPTIVGGTNLVYSAPDIMPLELHFSDLQRRFGVTVLVRVTSDESDVHPAVVYQEVAMWFHLFLHRHGTKKYNPQDVVLLRESANYKRPVSARLNAGIDASTSFTDGGQMLVGSSSTLAWMNDRLAFSRPDFVPVEMDAFRPNIVLDGLPPNAEDVIDRMALGWSHMRFSDLCVRCPVTQVTQATGTKRADKEPLAWLAKYRPSLPPKNAGATFAVNAVCEMPSPHILYVGQEGVVESEK